jgi:hypothetical protein
MNGHSGALEAIERVLNRGGDAADVLRQVVQILHERLYPYVAVRFVEGHTTQLGPAAGVRDADVSRFPIVFQGDHAADLEVQGELGDRDRTLLDRVATLVSPYALVGWDPGGAAGTP